MASWVAETYTGSTKAMDNLLLALKRLPGEKKSDNCPVPLGYNHCIDFHDFITHVAIRCSHTLLYVVYCQWCAIKRTF
jgi:hypothetical protein